VPKEKYDAFAILDLFIRHHGPADFGSSGMENAAIDS
jgi:hypothetical protein